jgi:hypothetical protein
MSEGRRLYTCTQSPSSLSVTRKPAKGCYVVHAANFRFQELGVLRSIRSMAASIITTQSRHQKDIGSLAHVLRSESEQRTPCTYSMRVLVPKLRFGM